VFFNGANSQILNTQVNNAQGELLLMQVTMLFTWTEYNMGNIKEAG